LRRRIARDPALEIDGAASLSEAVAGRDHILRRSALSGGLRQNTGIGDFCSLDFSGQTTAAQIAWPTLRKPLASCPETGAQTDCFYAGHHPTAVIDPTVKIGSGVSVQRMRS